MYYYATPKYKYYLVNKLLEKQIQFNSIKVLELIDTIVKMTYLSFETRAMFSQLFCEFGSSFQENGERLLYTSKFKSQVQWLSTDLQ